MFTSERARPEISVALCSYGGGISKIVAQRQLRDDNAKERAAVAAGETCIVTRHGEPVAELRPLQLAAAPCISREEVAALGAGGVRIDHHRFRADVDRVIDQES